MRARVLSLRGNGPVYVFSRSDRRRNLRKRPFARRRALTGSQAAPLFLPLRSALMQLVALRANSCRTDGCSESNEANKPIEVAAFRAALIKRALRRSAERFLVARPGK